MSKIKLVISGLIYPLTMLHYFWNAFERRDDIDLTVVGPFFDDWIPWAGGLTLPKRYVKMPTVTLPSRMSSHMMHPQMLLPYGVPDDADLWLQIDAGWRLSDRPLAKIAAHIQTDPHALKDQYRLPKMYSDYSFCMQTPYLEEGEIYLPYAFDPTIHFPEERKIEYDVCMIGLQYTQRIALATKLRNRGHAVRFGIGDVYDEYRHRYNESRVAVSWSSLQDLPTRVFEAFGMARPLVTNRVPDLSNWFVEGEHYLGFDTVDEAVSQVERLLNEPEFADEIAANAHRKVQNGHTWDDRVQQILETVKLI